MSFLRRYLDYATGNEAPEIFHVFAGLSSLASVVSRKIWIDQGYYIHYPNLYIVLVGDPGGGKSTALDISKGFVRSMKAIPLSADVTTVQSLLREMSNEDISKGSVLKKNFKRRDTGEIVEYTPISIFAGELINFLSMDPYGWINFLTTVYHEEVHEVKTKNKGDDLIKGPFINMLACLTPDTTANMLHQKIISSGFARRTIFVWGTGRGEPVAFPTITPAQREAIGFCKDWAEKLMQQKFNGPMQWTPEAREWYEDWYTTLRKNIFRLSTPTTAGYFESKHVQLMKVGMLMSVSESMDLKLELGHLQAALHFLEVAEKDLHKVFEGTGRNPSSGIAAKIMSTIESGREAVSLKQLQRVFYNDCERDELDKIIFHLRDIGKLKTADVSIGGVSRGLYLGTMEQIEALKTKLGAKLQTSEQPSTEPRNES